MVRNFLKISWRNIKKDRQFTLLNLTGLSVGLASALLIWLWINDELHVDKYNENDDRLYQVMANHPTDAGIKTIEGTAGLLGSALASAFPEIQYSTSVLPASWFPYGGAVEYGNVRMRSGGNYVGKDYFNIFTCKFLAGDQQKLLADKNSIAISEQLAAKLFSSPENAIGKIVSWTQNEFSGNYMVVGIFQKNPPSATDQFDILFNYDIVLERRSNLNYWQNSDPSTFVLVKNGTDINALNNKIRNFVQTKAKDARAQIFLTRFSETYLFGNYENGVRTGGRIVYVRLFSAVAVFILLIACINFMNLSTAKAAHRAKEVGIQKVVGAGRSTLIIQYLWESMLLVTLSLLLAAFLMALLLPAFNEITGKQLSFPWQLKPVAAVLGITLITGLIAGSYPAFYLSAFRPVAVLKGKVSTSAGEVLARKGLVVFQFAISVVFIAAVMIIYRQVQYIQSANLGYNRDQVIHFEIPLEIDSAKIKNAETFLQEIRNIPGVINASSYYHNLTGDHGAISGFDWPGKNPAMDIEFSNLEVGSDFIKTAGIKIIEGRDFSPGTNAMKEIVFNETAIKAMGLKDPVGKTVKFWNQERKIAGVAADFNFESFYHTIKPCFIQVYPVLPNVMIRMREGMDAAVIESAAKKFSDFYSGMAFDYRYLDEDYRALYASEMRVAVLTQYFAGLTIVIACLGLFGLATFTAQRRQKEIGIRKVIGASVSDITFLLANDFFKLVLIAIAIAFPAGWWIMNNWLSDFAYRINLSADIFLYTGLCALLLTLLAVSFQSIKAAVNNPVDSLRD